MLKNADEFQAIFYLSDFLKLEKQLEGKGIHVRLESIPTTKKETVVIHKNEFRLITFFSLPVPKSSDLGTSDPPNNQFLFHTQNLLAHATYSDSEFKHMYLYL